MSDAGEWIICQSDAADKYRDELDAINRGEYER